MSEELEVVLDAEITLLQEELRRVHPEIADELIDHCRKVGEKARKAELRRLKELKEL